MARCPWPHKRHYCRKGDAKEVMLKMQRKYRQAFVIYECRNCRKYCIARKNHESPVQNARRQNQSKRRIVP